MPTSNSWGKAFWLIPADIKKIEKPAQQTPNSKVSVSKPKDDTKFASHLADIFKWHSTDFCYQGA